MNDDSGVKALEGAQQAVSIRAANENFLDFERRLMGLIDDRTGRSRKCMKNCLIFIHTNSSRRKMRDGCWESVED